MSTPTTQAQSWLKAHENIAIAILALVLGLYGFNRWTEKSANDARAQVAISQTAQAQQDASVKALQAQLTAQTQQFAVSQAEMKTEILSLVSAIAQRDAATQTKVVAVSTPKTPTQAVVDLQATYTLAAPVTVTETGADIPTVDIQQFTVAKLEGDTAASDLRDTQSELMATQGNLSECNSLVGTLQKAVAQDKTDLAAHDKAAADEVAQVKADARRSKLHWFFWGVVTGFLGRSAIK
jgi:hypothetical protein